MIGRMAAAAILCGALMMPAAFAAETKPVPAPLPALSAAAAARPTLTISRPGASVVLTLAEIERLALYQADMATRWTPMSEWAGIRLADLLAAHGLGTVDRVTLRATDGYGIDLERAEIQAGDPILATRRDGAPLDPADKGPLFLLWPKTAETVLAGTSSDVAWIWSVDRIEAAP